MQISWENGFTISASVTGEEVTVSANREGCMSLANILLALADGQAGDHVHLDESNSLEEGSSALILERID